MNMLVAGASRRCEHPRSRTSLAHNPHLDRVKVGCLRCLRHVRRGRHHACNAKGQVFLRRFVK